MAYMAFTITITPTHSHTKENIDRHSSVHKHPVNPIELRIKALKPNETSLSMMTTHQMYDFPLTSDYPIFYYVSWSRRLLGTTDLV